MGTSGDDSPRRLAAILRDHKEDVVRAWVERVREDPRIPQSNRLSEPELRDEVPALLDRLVESLSRSSEIPAHAESLGRTAGHSAESRRHAEHRIRERYDLAAALRELSHLRVAIVELFGREQVNPSPGAMTAIHTAVDEALQTLAVAIAESTQARLRDQSALLDMFMSSAPAAFAVVDRDLRYLRVNEALAQMNGLPAAQHVGRSIGEIFPALREEYLELVRSVFESGESIVGLEAATPTPSSDGEIRHYLASLHPIRRDGGQPQAVGMIVVDITDQKKTEQRFREDAALRERFTGILSHDIRNPIAAIRMMVSAMLEEPDVGDVAVRRLRVIAASGARMDRMVRDLLDLTRTRHGDGIPMHRQETALDSVCREVIDEVGMGERPERIVLEVVGNCRGEWDPDRLAQVVSNLVTNALHYAPTDTPVLVRIDGTESAQVRLAVNNQGPPVSDEARNVMFDPFRRGADRGGHREGLGLGLFITAQIVKAHEGTIDVRSSVAEGTTFVVKLPRRA